MDTARLSPEVGVRGRHRTAKMTLIILICIITLLSEKADTVPMSSNEKRFSKSGTLMLSI
jgi:hypothetical protein